ncbi:MAG: cytochrome P450 [Caldimonas sp.]
MASATESASDTPGPALVEATIDMRHPAFRDDPHPLVRGLRERGRIARDVVGMWVMCHHADINTGLRSPLLSREPWRLPAYRKMRPYLADSTLERTTEQWMLFNDPPKHTRLRRLAQAAFKPPVIAALRERIGAITDDLLDALPIDAPFDLMTGLAQPLPVRVICDVLGLPASDFAQTKAWSDALALVIEPVSRREQRIAANRAAEEMVAYLRDHVARHRAAGRRDDLLGLLVAAQDDGGALDEDELLGNLILHFIAGHETTTNLIGNGTWSLLRHPPELQRLRDRPELVGSAVDEMLRFEGSVNMVARHTISPYRVDDVVVPPEQVLFFMIGAANRDPAVFAEPDRFDVGRAPNPHLAFGAGIHYCLGAPLARLEAEIVFTRLLHRYPQLHLVDAQPRWRPLINLRGLESLHLTAVEPRAVAALA